jgi:oxygen-independent coproporphyrinogen III oxidase
MAGIYIHIPFCRQACHYCDFHFSTNLKNQEEMVNMICAEIANRKEYLDEEIHTIYFGGGTPSLLSALQIQSILSAIFRNFQVSKNPEITLEANPEDLSTRKLEELRDTNVNRLSIGIQTFHDEKLKWMNRAHNSNDARTAFKNARKAGFENISLDLIYARPDEDSDAWMNDLKQIIALNPEHVSLYGLTIEDKTVFRKWEKDNKLVQLPEEEAAEQYLNAVEFLNESEFQQYEVSSFCKEGFESRHNSAYWAGVHYLGVGPGAHSFNGNVRHINIRNNIKYIQHVKNGESHFETENLSKNQKINERILTQLRTSKGLDLAKIKNEWRVDLRQDHSEFLNDLISRKLALIENDKINLLPHGFLIADEIALRLFIQE